MTTDPTQDSAETVERVLGEHEIVHQSDGDYCEIAWIECSCEDDEWCDPDLTYLEQQLAHRKHQATQVTQALGTTGGLTESERLTFSDDERAALARAICPCGHEANWHSGLIGCNAEDWDQPECDCRCDWLEAVVPTLEALVAARLAAPYDLRDKVLALADEFEENAWDCARQPGDREKGEGVGWQGAMYRLRALVGDGGGAP